jgi:hypothetical protein
MIGQRICLIMSEPRGMVLCQGKNCSAACPRTIVGETYWFCEIIEGHKGREGSEDELGIFQDIRSHGPCVNNGPIRSRDTRFSLRNHDLSAHPGGMDHEQ